MTTNKINNSLLLTIKFYLNFKHLLTSNFNLFIHNSKLNNQLLFAYLQKLNRTMFNFRNKMNSTKKTKSLNPNKKTGTARIGSASSCILRKGLPWFGFRNLKLKSTTFSKNLLYSIILKHKNILSIHNLEHIKFLYSTINNFDIYTQLTHKKVKESNPIILYNKNLLPYTVFNFIY